MKTRHARPMPIRLSAGSEPPSEFRLFPLGKVETTKGTFFLDPEDAQACLDAHAAYANDLSIDWGHGAFEEAEGKPQPAAGWIGGLELRGDGLWAVRVSWTETAAGMLKRREQRYFSPAFTTDEAGHIRSIINCALTLIPATHGLTPLVASRASYRGSAARNTTMKTKYLKAAALLALADEMSGEKASDEQKELAAKLRKMAEDAEELKLADEHEEPDGDEKASDSEDEDKEKASDDEKDEKKASRDIAKLAREITGASSPAAVMGKLQAFKELSGQVVALSKQVAELTGEGRKAKVDAVIAKASRDGKVTPAMIKSGRLHKMGMRDLGELEGFISELPAVVAMQDGKPVETLSANPSTVPTILSADQEKILRNLGVDPKDQKAVTAILSNQPR